MLVVASLAVDTEDPSTVVTTLLKAAKLLKVVEIHVEIPDLDADAPIKYHPAQAKLIPLED